MAEKTMLVCDVCGKPATQSVRFQVDGKNRVKDFCEQHLAELIKGSRAPRRGRPSGSSTKTTTRKRSAATRKKPKRR